MPKVPRKTAKQEKESGSQAPTLAHKRPQCGRFVSRKRYVRKTVLKGGLGQEVGQPSNVKGSTVCHRRLYLS